MSEDKGETVQGFWWDKNKGANGQWISFGGLGTLKMKSNENIAKGVCHMVFHTQVTKKLRYNCNIYFWHKHKDLTQVKDDDAISNLLLKEINELLFPQVTLQESKDLKDISNQDTSEVDAEIVKLPDAVVNENSGKQDNNNDIFLDPERIVCVTGQNYIDEKESAHMTRLAWIFPTKQNATQFLATWHAARKAHEEHQHKDSKSSQEKT